MKILVKEKKQKKVFFHQASAFLDSVFCASLVSQRAKNRSESKFDEIPSFQMYNVWAKFQASWWRFWC